jgi:hypothetical protein
MTAQPPSRYIELTKQVENLRDSVKECRVLSQSFEQISFDISGEVRKTTPADLNVEKLQQLGNILREAKSLIALLQGDAGKSWSHLNDSRVIYLQREKGKQSDDTAS